MYDELKLNIKGDEYFTKIDFARIIGKFPSAIAKLIYQGNKFRKLKAVRLGHYTYVKASELTEFPHVPSGKAGQGENVKPYYYDEEGNIIPTII